MEQTVVDVTDLSRSFGGKSALEGVSFRATAGQIYGLVGANGAGKTTLLKHLLGLLRAATGSVRVFGLDPVRDPVGVLRRVGYLSEERELPEWMRVDELMRYTQAFHPTWDAAYARELLETFALDPSKKVKELSKGMRAQAGLLVAVAHRPELLILDEPSSGLDAVVRRDILDAIVRTVADDGRTVIFSSHLLDEVERMSDHVTLMHHGRVTLSGPLDDVRRGYQRSRVRFAAALRATARPRDRAGHGRGRPHVERRPQRIARAVPPLGAGARRRGRRIARRHARRDLPGARRPQPPAGGGGMTLRSPIVAILWELWRVTRVEAAWKLALRDRRRHWPYLALSPPLRLPTMRRSYKDATCAAIALDPHRPAALDRMAVDGEAQWRATRLSALSPLHPSGSDGSHRRPSDGVSHRRVVGDIPRVGACS